MGRPFVSVLIDTYNHERFIEQAVVSVLEQDFPHSDREIVVVDDGSTDRTPKILRKFEPHLRIIRKANGGQASAFNVGIPACLGDIVAFLDGDDWWAKGKLAAVTEALARQKDVGVVGHGITEVYQDGREQTELLREIPRFRLTSKEGARAFRLRKSFLGTSRLTCRSDVLRRVGQVPEALRIEADEYLFTIAAAFSDVLILREALTFYRLHDSNAFQISSGTMPALQRKLAVLDALCKWLKARLREEGVSDDIAAIVLESVETEAEIVRLRSEGGFPWATVFAELRNYRIAHKQASIAHWIFKCLSLLPAFFLPPRVYFVLRGYVSENSAYRSARTRLLPFLQPTHVDRHHTTGRQ